MWVVVTLASLAVFISLVLCVPLDATLSVEADGRPKFRMKLAWLFGLVSKELTEGKKPEEKKEVAEGKRKPRDRRREAKTIFQILRTRGLLRQVTGLVRNTFSCLRIRELRVNLKVGLDDPADTGLLWAVIGPATVFLSSLSPHEIKVQPSFADEAVFEGYLHSTVRLQPIQLALPFTRFAFSLATVRAVKTVVSTRWKRKK